MAASFSIKRGTAGVTDPRLYSQLPFTAILVVSAYSRLAYPIIRRTRKENKIKVTELDRRNVKVTRTETRYILNEKVFQLDRCPDWAQYEAVDEDGHAYWYEYKPNQYAASWRNTAPRLGSHIHTDTLFDATDWWNSLIRRPQKVLEVTMADLEKKFGCKVKIVKEL